MAWRYYGIEDLDLTAGQRATLVAALQNLAANTPRPEWRNHWRIRNDNRAAIFEANWNTLDWTDETIAQRLANIFGVSIVNITHSHQTTPYGPVATYAYNAVDKLRVIAFGGLGAAWPDSHAAVLAYLAANIEQWTEEIP